MSAHKFPKADGAYWSTLENYTPQWAMTPLQLLFFAVFTFTKMQFFWGGNTCGIGEIRMTK